jgi:hypothetical protein
MLLCAYIQLVMGVIEDKKLEFMATRCTIYNYIKEHLSKI